MPILRRPFSQLFDRDQQTASKPRQFVLDAWRNYRIRLPGDQAISLQPLQGEREHPLGYAFNTAPQFAESHLAVAQQPHNLHAPFISHAVQNVPHRQTFAANMIVTR